MNGNHVIRLNDLNHLRNLITRHFNLSDLNKLSFDLGIDFEELSGSNKTEKVQELILYCDRHMILPQLLAACRAELGMG